MSPVSLDSYIGLDATTGGTISGDDHLLQSIRDILTTPKGTRVMRRAYGTDQPIDAPETPGVVAAVVAASAEAMIDYEPRVVLQQVLTDTITAGQVIPDLIVELNGQTTTISGATP